MAHVNGWDAVVRIKTGSEFALTVPGRDRLERASTPASSHTYNFYGSVGQFAARDVVNHFVVTEEIADVALRSLEQRTDLDDETRNEARSLIERAKGNAFGLLIAAEHATDGTVAVDLVRHEARAAGVHI